MNRLYIFCIFLFLINYSIGAQDDDKKIIVIIISFDNEKQKLNYNLDSDNTQKFSNIDDLLLLFKQNDSALNKIINIKSKIKLKAEQINFILDAFAKKNIKISSFIVPTNATPGWYDAIKKNKEK